jgi:hypothetical protein
MRETSLPLLLTKERNIFHHYGIGISISFGMLHLLTISSFLADTKIAKILVSAEIQVSVIH